MISGASIKENKKRDELYMEFISFFSLLKRSSNHLDNETYPAQIVKELALCDNVFQSAIPCVSLFTYLSLSLYIYIYIKRERERERERERRMSLNWKPGSRFSKSVQCWVQTHSSNYWYDNNSKFYIPILMYWTLSIPWWGDTCCMDKYPF